MLTVAFFLLLLLFYFFLFIFFFNAQNQFAVRAKAMLIFFKNHSLANKPPI